jgi:hypothetical protein
MIDRESLRMPVQRCSVILGEMGDLMHDIQQRLMDVAEIGMYSSLWADIKGEQVAIIDATAPLPLNQLSDAFEVADFLAKLKRDIRISVTGKR